MNASPRGLRVREAVDRIADDPVMRQYLALPLDTEGVVLPSHRKHAAELVKILRRRPKSEA